MMANVAKRMNCGRDGVRKMIEWVRMGCMQIIGIGMMGAND